MPASRRRPSSQFCHLINDAAHSNPRGSTSLSAEKFDNSVTLSRSGLAVPGLLQVGVVNTRPEKYPVRMEVELTRDQAEELRVRGEWERTTVAELIRRAIMDSSGSCLFCPPAALGRSGFAELPLSDIIKDAAICPLARPMVSSLRGSRLEIACKMSKTSIQAGSPRCFGRLARYLHRCAVRNGA